ncbi:hypothetical protein M8J77_003201 [Diaphorina citri]|nr:hypothetical protein M8J77_003201 [Diaphorina citri]
MSSTDSVSILDPLDIRQDLIGNEVDKNEEDVEFVVVGLDEKDDIVLNDDDDEDTMDAFEGDTAQDDLQDPQDNQSAPVRHFNLGTPCKEEVGNYVIKYVLDGKQHPGLAVYDDENSDGVAINMDGTVLQNLNDGEVLIIMNENRMTDSTSQHGKDFFFLTNLSGAVVNTVDFVSGDLTDSAVPNVLIQREDGQYETLSATDSCETLENETLETSPGEGHDETQQYVFEQSEIDETAGHGVESITDEIDETGHVEIDETSHAVADEMDETSHGVETVTDEIDETVEVTAPPVRRGRPRKRFILKDKGTVFRENFSDENSEIPIDQQNLNLDHMTGDELSQLVSLSTFRSQLRGAREIRPRDPLATTTSAYQCGECGKQFTRKFSLNAHLHVHYGSSNYKCPLCGKFFIQLCHMKDHIQAHGGLKPYVCTYCGKAFARASDLKRHIDAHLGVKKFACETCGKLFSSKHGLKYHVRTHKGTKPYSCPICIGKSYVQASALAAHMKCHLRDRTQDPESVSLKLEDEETAVLQQICIQEEEVLMMEEEVMIKQEEEEEEQIIDEIQEEIEI